SGAGDEESGRGSHGGHHDDTTDREPARRLVQRRRHEGVVPAGLRRDRERDGRFRVRARAVLRRGAHRRERPHEGASPRDHQPQRRRLSGHRVPPRADGRHVGTQGGADAVRSHRHRGRSRRQLRPDHPVGRDARSAQGGMTPVLLRGDSAVVTHVGNSPDRRRLHPFGRLAVRRHHSGHDRCPRGEKSEMKVKARSTLALLAAGLLVAAGCGSDNSKSSSSGGATTTAASGGATTTAASAGATTTAAAGGSSAAAPWGWPGDAATGYLAPNQPDVNRDGKVVVAIISPGDTNDHGYYEGFVDAAKSFAQQQGWTVTIVDKVPDSQAAQAARNACQQKPDMVAIAASELKDAIPVAQEDVCKGTVWYVAGGAGVNQTPYF